MLNFQRLSKACGSFTNRAISTRKIRPERVAGAPLFEQVPFAGPPERVFRDTRTYRSARESKLLVSRSSEDGFVCV